MLRDSFGKTSLHYACNLFEDAAALRSLIRAGSSVNAVDHDGFTPLFLTKSGDVVLELLRSRADPRILNNCKQTPLHYASSGDIVDIIVASGCVSNPQHQSMTPLHNACNAEVARRLIQRNADVNARTNSGKSPLHFVVDADVAAALVSARADVTARDGRGNTALHYAHSPALARYFLRAGVPLDVSAVSNGFAPIEKIPGFDSAVVLYEAGVAFPAPSDKKRRQLADKVEFTGTQRKRFSEFQRFNKKLALVSLCRRSAFVAAFGRDAAVSREYRTILSSSLRPWFFAFTEIGGLLSPAMKDMGKYASNWTASLSAMHSRRDMVRSPISKRCAVVSDDDDDNDEDFRMSGGAASAGGAAIAVPRLRSRMGGISFNSSLFCISEVHRLRCAASAGLAGFLVSHLMTAWPPCHSAKVLSRSTSSVLAMELHSTTPIDKIIAQDTSE